MYTHGDLPITGTYSTVVTSRCVAAVCETYPVEGLSGCRPAPLALEIFRKKLPEVLDSVTTDLLPIFRQLKLLHLLRNRFWVRRANNTAAATEHDCYEYCMTL